MACCVWEAWAWRGGVLRVGAEDAGWLDGVLRVGGVNAVGSTACCVWRRGRGEAQGVLHGTEGADTLGGALRDGGAATGCGGSAAEAAATVRADRCVRAALRPAASSWAGPSRSVGPVARGVAAGGVGARSVIARGVRLVASARDRSSRVASRAASRAIGHRAGRCGCWRRRAWRCGWRRRRAWRCGWWRRRAWHRARYSGWRWRARRGARRAEERRRVERGVLGERVDRGGFGLGVVADRLGHRAQRGSFGGGVLPLSISVRTTCCSTKNAPCACACVPLLEPRGKQRRHQAREHERRDAQPVLVREVLEVALELERGRVALVADRARARASRSRSSAGG